MQHGHLRVIKKEKATDDHACTITITCGQPSDSGNMAVELTWDGDPVLASYLLENVQGVIAESEDL